MKIFETHTHLDDDVFDEDRDDLINEMLGSEGTLDYIVNVGASLRGCQASLELADKYEKIYAAIGVHPEDVYNLSDSDIDWLRENAKSNSKVVAIGEIGLEYHYLDEDDEDSSSDEEASICDNSQSYCIEMSDEEIEKIRRDKIERKKSLQKKWFIEQLKLAEELKLPVVIHSREACKDTLDILKVYPVSKGGIIHCYSYSVETAKELVKMGYHIGVGGVVTFKNAKKLVEVVEWLPLDRLLLETDSPYMAPVPFRGKRNDSRYIKYIAEKIAEIKGVTAQEIIDVTNENARRLLLNAPV